MRLSQVRFQTPRHGFWSERSTPNKKWVRCYPDRGWNKNERAFLYAQWLSYQVCYRNIIIEEPAALLPIRAANTDCNRPWVWVHVRKLHVYRQWKFFRNLCSSILDWLDHWTFFRFAWRLTKATLNVLTFLTLLKLILSSLWRRNANTELVRKIIYMSLTFPLLAHVDLCQSLCLWLILTRKKYCTSVHKSVQVFVCVCARALACVHSPTNMTLPLLFSGGNGKKKHSVFQISHS